METGAPARDGFVHRTIEKAFRTFDPAMRRSQAKADILASKSLVEGAELFKAKSKVARGCAVEAKRELVDTLSTAVYRIGETAQDCRRREVNVALPRLKDMQPDGATYPEG